jgi:hypothetical protein
MESRMKNIFKRTKKQIQEYWTIDLNNFKPIDGKWYYLGCIFKKEGTIIGIDEFHAVQTKSQVKSKKALEYFRNCLCMDEKDAKVRFKL